MELIKVTDENGEEISRDMSEYTPMKDRDIVNLYSMISHSHEWKLVNFKIDQDDLITR